MRLFSTLPLAGLFASFIVTGACSSGSSGSPGGTSSDSGLGPESGSSSGSSGSSSGGGSDAASGSSSGSDAASGSDGGPAPTLLASGLDAPVALTVVGSSLYWINGPGTNGSLVDSAPITGGGATPRVGSALLAGDLASDGTELYFGLLDPPGSMFEIDDSQLDGSNVNPLSTGITGWSGPTSQNGATDLFIVGGNLYFRCQPGGATAETLCKCANTVGSIAAGLYTPTTATDVYSIEGVLAAGSYGVVIAYTDKSVSSGSTTLDLGVVPLTGGVPAPFFTLAQSAAQTMPSFENGGGLAVVGSDAIYLTSAAGSNEVHVMSVPLAGGTPTAIADLEPWTATWLAADASGIYVDQTSASGSPGIYSVSKNGAATLFQAAGAASTSTAAPRDFALDANNLYWVAGDSTGHASLYAKAR